jgi:hypothetical protein
MAGAGLPTGAHWLLERTMDKPLWVERTKPANPSKLGVFLACKLRYFFETERPVLKILGDHPSALLCPLASNVACALIDLHALHIGTGLSTRP